MPFGGKLHRVQKSGNGIRADSLAIHLFDGGNGAMANPQAIDYFVALSQDFD